jgi:hypothetical protein
MDVFLGCLYVPVYLLQLLNVIFDGIAAECYSRLFLSDFNPFIKVKYVHNRSMLAYCKRWSLHQQQETVSNI